MDRKFMHVVVSAPDWKSVTLKYRRHRLVEYLNKQLDTKELVCIYPVKATPRKPSSYLKAISEIKGNSSGLENMLGAKEYALPGFFPLNCLKNTHGLFHNYNKLKDLLNSRGFKKILWFTYPVFPYLADSFNWDLIVYDCSDLWTVYSSGVNPFILAPFKTKRRQKNAELKIIDHSNIIFASSDYLAEVIERKTGRQALVVENGVEVNKFTNMNLSAVDVLKNIPRPRLGFVGGMKPKIDFLLLNDLARHNPQWNIVLVGPEPSKKSKAFMKLLKNDNVFSIGTVSPDKIPDYINALDIGLLPYKEIEYNKGVFPLKLFEYLALGLPVVGCGLSSTDKYAQDKAYLHVNRKQFEGACREAITWLNNSDKFFLQKRVELAKNFDWDSKFDFMYNNVLRMVDS